MNRIKSLETILVLVLASGVIYWWFGRSPYLLLIAGILILTGLFIPPLAAIIHRGWMKLAEGIGYVMSKVVLTLVFVLVLVPLSFIARVFRKNNTIRMKPGGNSYYKKRNYTYTKENLENVW